MDCLGKPYRMIQDNKQPPQSKPPSAEDTLRRSAASAMREDDDRRDSIIDRRSGLDRRDTQKFVERRRANDAPPASGPDTPEDASAAANLNTNLERRRGPGRRRTDFMKSADEGEMTQEQFLFIMAIDAFKRVNGKTFPTWTDVLEVIRKLGYRKTMPSELKNLGANVEDWTERPDAPAGVFKQAEEEPQD